MTPIHILLFASSALFAWAMGSHYSGAVMGTAYGAGVLSLRQALALAAVFAFIGSVTVSVNVIDTYAHGLVTTASPVDIAAALLAAAVVTTISTYFKLPTSTIQIYTFTLLGVALVGHLPIHAAGFGLVILFWIIGPLAAFGIGHLLARFGLGTLGTAERGQRVLRWFVVGASIYSSITLGSNDVSNAVASLVMLKVLTPHMAGLWGGAFMALGVVTWGSRLLGRVGHDIVKLDVPMAATAQLSQAVTLSAINAAGYNASINQTIVGGLAGVGSAVESAKLDRRVIRNIVVSWGWSPVLGIGSSVVASLVLHAIFGQ